MDDVVTMMLLVLVLSGFTLLSDGSLTMTKEEVAAVRQEYTDMQSDNEALKAALVQHQKALKAELSRRCI